MNKYDLAKKIKEKMYIGQGISFQDCIKIFSKYEQKPMKIKSAICVLLYFNCVVFREFGGVCYVVKSSNNELIYNKDKKTRLDNLIINLERVYSRIYKLF